MGAEELKPYSLAPILLPISRPQVAKCPVADVLIAAFAERFQGIITRNASDFRNILPTLRIVEP